MTAPSRDDPAVAGTSRLIGGAWGDHAARRTSSWWWTPVRVALALTVLVSVLGYAQKATCLGTYGYANEHQYTHLCYADTYALYTDEDLNQKVDASGQVVGRLSVPYRDHPVEYPPVIGGMMWLAAEVTNAVRPHQPTVSGSDDRGRVFFDLTALGLALCALVSTWTVTRLAGRRRWDAVMVAASPVLLLHAFTNWDLAAVALTGLGLWAWSRGTRASPLVAGALLGVGIATKLYPVLVLLGLLMLCARAGRWRAAGEAVGGAVLGMVVCYLPAVLISKPFAFPAGCPANLQHPLSGWRWFDGLSRIRGADVGSVWLVLQHLRGKPLDGGLVCNQAPAVLNALTAVAMLLLIAGVAALVAAAPRRPRVAAVAFLLVAGFTMLNKVDSPQYALWLVPLAVLARPRWAEILVWQVAEVLLGAANLYELVGQDHSYQGLPMGYYIAFIVLRDVVLIGLMSLVVRDAIWPDHDIVRRDGVDDPVGGVLAGAPDRFGALSSVGWARWVELGRVGSVGRTGDGARRSGEPLTVMGTMES